MRLVHLQTPAFLVDLPTLRSNAERMRRKAVESGVTLRPHVKTHKTVEAARLQLGAHRGPITVSTLAEAEFFSSHGFEDITYAVPIAPDKLERVAALHRSMPRFQILLDHPETLNAVEEFSRSHGIRLRVALKIDCGYHRSGMRPEDPETFATASRLARSEVLELDGLLTHAGHAYHASSVEEIAAIAGDEATAVIAVRNRLREQGSDISKLSIGSTPTASVVERFPEVDEVRPGNYVFYDVFQARLGSCSLADVAVSVLATVIGAYREERRAVVDAGALALSKDRGPEHLQEDPGYGIVCDLDGRPLPGAHLRAISQEHGEIHLGHEANPDSIRIGRRVRILPNHSCLTAALHDRFYVLEGGRVIDEWRPVRGW